MPSAVAGILDARGGLRVVITQRWRMRHHVGKREQLFILPDLTVEEPVPLAQVSALIDTVKRYVTKQLAPTNHCGECTACCFTLFIDDPDLRKASRSDCPNCSSGFGCKLYHRRPSACRRFECLWLRSQSRSDRMASELRPDRCGVIFTIDQHDPLIFEIHAADPGRTEYPLELGDFIRSMQATGFTGKYVTGYMGEGPA